MTTFASLDLHPTLVQTVADLGYTEPTPIQSALIPHLLTGRDVIGQAQTGTGKTAAFALPMLHHLADAGRGAVHGLVIVPTRELAMQVARAVHEYGQALDMRVLPVYGGQSYDRQIRRLRQGVDVVVGTPGRLLDLINKKALDLSQVGRVVLDEADEMLSMGFIEDLEAILQATPANRQTACLSATLPSGIRRLADRYLRDPEHCATGRANSTGGSIEQRRYLVHRHDKVAALSRLLEVESVTAAIVFVRTRADTNEVAAALQGRGYQAEAISGELSQQARTQVLQRFRREEIRLLVATDVAARGLDIDHVSHVFNMELPRDPEVYVHRVGRTGRAGKTGVAISLVAPNERRRMSRIEQLTKQRVEQRPLPTAEDVAKQRDAALSEQLEVWLRRDRCHRERQMVDALVEAGHDPADVAAAALKIARREDEKGAVEAIETVVEKAPRRHEKPRRPGRPGGNGGRRDRAGNSHEAGMVRLQMDAGRTSGIRPAHVVGAIARYAQIPGRALGRISIGDETTWVDVPESLVGQVLSRDGGYRIGKQRLTLVRADG